MTASRRTSSGHAGAFVLLLSVAVLTYGIALALACGVNSPAVLFAPTRHLTMEDAIGLPASIRLMALRADDGVRLTGLRVDGYAGRPWVLFFYGNAESSLVERPRLQWLHDRYGVNVVCIDYRGYGFSDGAPDPGLIRNDALREFDWVRAQARQAPIIVYGYSLGSQLAIHVAAQRPAAGVIVEAAPASAEEMAGWLQRHWQIQALRWLVSPLMPLKADARVIDFLSAEREVRGLRAPLVVVHGTRDDVIPFDQGRAIYAAAAATQKRFVAVENGGHLNLDYSRPPIVNAIDWLIVDSERSARPVKNL